MVQTPEKSITLEEFLKLPETEPASEYSNGQIIQKPMPQGEHSTIQTELSTAINLALKPQKIARGAITRPLFCQGTTIDGGRCMGLAVRVKRCTFPQGLIVVLSTALRASSRFCLRLLLYGRL